MADALSRHTLPLDNDDPGVHIASVLTSLDPQLDQIRVAAKAVMGHDEERHFCEIHFLENFVFIFAKIINSKNRKANHHYKELFAEEYSQT